ncbi:MAG: S8 family peptidase [Bacteroidia bacterium]|nr:S8 family peptidase [Bacteroidia bacterium]
MKSWLPCLCLLLVSVLGHTQKIYRSLKYSDPFLAGKVHIMLVENTEFDSVKSRQLENVLHGLGFLSIQKRFPTAVKPSKPYSPQGERMADISQLYTIKIKEDISPEQAVSRLEKLKWIQFAEPHFVPEPCYIPNDDSISAQYALSRIKAFAAWDIQKGDTSILIGVTDTGHEPMHPDLHTNIRRNWADPVNGMDDDQDGFTDNFMGWDTGSNDNDPSVELSYHGIHVTGLCCAVTDNLLGISGTGFKTQYLPVKIADAQGILTGAYEGLIYAAEHGCHVINCSWGGNQYSEINQELIRYAVVNKNALVICGAGNKNEERLFYPAAYPYALSVGSSDMRDMKPEFSNYGYNIGLVAPGDYVLSTWANGTYVKSGGTSMSAPIVAGAAALVKAAFPDWNSRQLMEQLLISADRIDTLPQNEAWKEKMGAGRLNMLRALTLGGVPAVRLQEIQVNDTGTGLFLPGDTLSLSGLLVNYLAGAQQVQLSLGTESNAVQIINPQKTMGPMATLASVQIDTAPFLIAVNSTAGVNEQVVLKLTINADGQVRNQFIQLVVHADFINVRTLALQASFGSDGTVAPTGYNYIKANGFKRTGQMQLLAEGGLMSGAAGKGVADNMRGAADDQHDWYPLTILHKSSNSTENIKEFNGSFQSEADFLKLSVQQRVIESRLPEHQNFFIAEYTQSNQNPEPLTQFYSGMFCDWDLGEPGANRAAYSPGLKMAYVHTIPLDTLYTAVQLLSDMPAHCYAFDNISGGSGGIDLTDGFTNDEKFQALSQVRDQAGMAPSGSDVISLLSAGPFSLNPNDELRLAFAFHACTSLTELTQSAIQALNLYRQTVLPMQIVSHTAPPQLKVFPNPCRGLFSIQQQSTHQPPAVFDLQGRPVMASVDKTAEGWLVKLHEPKAGVYFVKMLTPKGLKGTTLLVQE